MSYCTALRGLTGDLQQAAVISAVEDRELWTTLQLATGAAGFSALQ
jgi:hypothetical protein